MIIIAQQNGLLLIFIFVVILIWVLDTIFDFIKK